PLLCLMTLSCHRPAYPVIVTLSLHDALPIWARGRSMLSTWSTMTCFIWPLEVSRMVPRGILGSFSKIFSRMDFRMEKVALWEMEDRKSTRLNSSHVSISYAVFCLKKKNNQL